MRVVELVGIAGFDEAFRLVERATPALRPGDVLVRVRAASLNYRDLLLPMGTFPVPGDYAGRIPLSDGAGEVVGVGSEVYRFKIGDRVAANALPTWTGGALTERDIGESIGFFKDGMAAEFVALDQQALVLLPDYLSFEQAASLPCAGVSAWSCLTGGARPTQPGDMVLVQGSGGVSLFALQLAKVFGARVIATTSSHAKADRLRALGADFVINYRDRPDWDVAVLDATGGRGVDRVIEVGGASTIERSARCTRLGGTISSVGFVGGRTGGIDPLNVISRMLSLNGYMMGSRTQFEDMLKAMNTHRLTPVIDKIFPCEDIGASFAYLESGEHMGKIIVSITD